MKLQTLQQIKIDVEQGCKSYYVYLLFKPDGTPFYVGKGKSNRISAHEAETRYFMNGRTWKGINTFKLNIIKKIWSEGGEVLYQIDSWHDVSEEAGEREIELVKKFGRRILNEGPLTNIRDGGEVWSEETRKLFGEKIRQHYIDHPEAREKLSQSIKQHYIDYPEAREKLSQSIKQHYIDHPEAGEKLSQSIKQHYIDHPEAREVASERMTQFYIDHPEMRDQISESVQCYIADHPEFIDNLMDGKNQWIEEYPEEYAEAERKRLEICQSQEHRDKVSEIMTEYFALHPEAIEHLVSQGKLFWEDNPEAKDKARQRAIDNQSHENLARWREENPDLLRKKQEDHGEKMKSWYESNSDEAKELACRRNKVLRSTDHRKKMSNKTKKFMDANPDIALARVDAMVKGVKEKVGVRQNCLQLVQEKLYQYGEIDYQKDFVTPKMLYRWRQKGLLDKYFPDMPLSRKKQDWEIYSQLI